MALGMTMSIVIILVIAIGIAIGSSMIITLGFLPLNKRSFNAVYRTQERKHGTATSRRVRTEPLLLDPWTEPDDDLTG